MRDVLSEMYEDPSLKEFKVSKYNEVKVAWENYQTALYKGTGIDWRTDPNLKDTPHRVAKSMVFERCRYLFEGEDSYKKNLRVEFPSEYNGLIIEEPINAYSLCPHHFENVTYIVRVGYISTGKVIGLSKLGRVVKLLAAQPILQEDYIVKLADIFEEVLTPEGIGIIVKGQHNCMCSRGLSEPNIWVTMSEMRGTFRKNASVKNEFMKLSCQKN